MDDSVVMKPSPNVVFQELEGETVLLHLKTERYYSLDDVGTRIWHLLTEHGNAAAVVARMKEEYAVDEAALRQDVEALLSDLCRADLVIVEAQQTRAAA